MGGPHPQPAGSHGAAGPEEAALQGGVRPARLGPPLSADPSVPSLSAQAQPVSLRAVLPYAAPQPYFPWYCGPAVKRGC